MTPLLIAALFIEGLIAVGLGFWGLGQILAEERAEDDQ